MSHPLREAISLGIFSLLDFGGGYLIASFNEAFFDSGYKKLFSGKDNLDTPDTAMGSLAIRISLQILSTAFVGSELRSLIHGPKDVDGFSAILFILGISQQPKLFCKLQALGDLVLTELGYRSVSPPPTEKS